MTSPTGPTQIHPTAIVDPRAQLGQGVQVGPGAVIGSEVVVGDGSQIGAHAVLDGRLQLGRDNRVFPGACLGLAPQDLKYDGAPTEVVIGDGNTFRECVTVNRATAEGERTIIGSGNLLMAYCHIGHNCRLGDRIVLANSVGVAGHVEIDDRAVIGGLTGIHQFVHIGSLAMVGGMSRVVRDVPPFLTVEGSPCRVRGLNRVGLRRSGIGDRDNGAELKELEEIWTLLYRQGLVLAEALQQARQRSLRPSADLLCRFLEASLGPGRRGPTAMQR